MVARLRAAMLGLGLLTLLTLDAPVWSWVAVAALLGATCPQVGSLALVVVPRLSAVLAAVLTRRTRG